MNNRKKAFSIALSVVVFLASLFLFACKDQSKKNNLKKIAGPVNSADHTEAVLISANQVKQLQRVEPKLSRIAMEFRGVVVIEVMIDKTGNVCKARVISGHPIINDPVLTAVKLWIYEPYVIDGTAKPARFVIAIHFDY
jgi:TonB family protein